MVAESHVDELYRATHYNTAGEGVGPACINCGRGPLEHGREATCRIVRQGYPHPIAYTYEAAYHCPVCTMRRFGVDAEGWIPESARDGEGNPVGALAPWEEWEEYGEPFPQVLTCDTCGGEIARAEG